MNAPSTLVCLAFLACFSSSFGQEPERRGWVLKLRSQLPFKVESELQPAVLMPKVVVAGNDSDWSRIKIERDLEKLFSKKPSASPKIVSEPDSLKLGKSNSYEDVPFFGTIIGGSQEFRRLRGDFDVKFGDMTGKFSFKKGLMFPLGSDRRKNIILRPSNKKTLSFRFEF